MAADTESDWVSRFADEVIAEAKRRSRENLIVCASGISPSGPIHLGNLREVMTPHFVADEIRQRGYDCVHILSWDEWDRFRKVPAGVDSSWQEHIGKPLTLVPPPPDSPYPNWAEHFKAPLMRAISHMGIEVQAISQTEKYTSGAYTQQILRAMRERSRIDSILNKYRTKTSKSETGDPQEKKASDGTYYPYKPYCTVCKRDLTTIVAYDDETTAMTYECECGHSETVRLSEFHHGKLVWKVDWPMRWAYENVIFEPSGVDHSSPGSSYVVGGHIVSEVFGGQQPIGPMYAFVGIKGMAKMSSSAGGVPTPSDALEVLEAPMLRWLYARRKPQQSFTISFDQDIQRLYDEWDALAARVTRDAAPGAEATAYIRATRTASAELPTTPHPLPFRMLVSIADVTHENREQTLRILAEVDPEKPINSLDEVQPRLENAGNWLREYASLEQRTHVRDQPDLPLLSSLSSTQREGLRLLIDGLSQHWSLEGLTSLVYGVPKIQAGLPLDTKPNPELKASQREFFSVLYELLVGRDTGPRLPTLLLSIGQERVRMLLGG